MIPVNGFCSTELEYDSVARQYTIPIERLINLANGNPFVVVNGQPTIRLNIRGQVRDFVYNRSYYGDGDRLVSVDYTNGQQTVRVIAHGS